MFSCSDDDSYGKLDGIDMVNRAISIADGETLRAKKVSEVVLSYNNLVAVNDGVSATLNGNPVVAKADGMNLVIELSLQPYTEYTLEIPAGLVGRADDPSITAPAKTVTFNTNAGIDKSKVRTTLHNPSATSEAQKLYSYLLSLYGEKQLSGAMGEIAWGSRNIDVVAQATGKYPTIIGFDYLHLASSPANWIDYGDITPVRDAWNNGGIISMMWHWNTPESASSFTVSTQETAMLPDWSASLQLTDESSLAIWANAAVGDKIVVKIKDVAAGAQGSVKGSDWAQIGDGLEYFEISGDSYTVVITDGILEKLLASGAIISGHDYTLTGVYLEKAPGQLLSNNSFDPEAALTPGTWQNDIINADIDKLAGYLKLIRDAGIPVLWRPLHEAAGDYTWGPWFWWGNKGVDVTKRLWIYLHDKLTNEYGLDNLIWVWTVQVTDAGQVASVEKAKAAYPGDQYVDIVGADLYEDAPLMCRTDKFDVVNSVVDGKLMVALAECGNLLDPVAAYEDNALWSYFMRWYDYNSDNDTYGFNGADNTIEAWQTVLDNPLVINRGQNTSIK